MPEADKPIDRGDEIVDKQAELAAIAEKEAAEAAAAAAKAAELAAKGEDEEVEETEEEKAEREAAEKRKRARVPLSRHEEIVKAAKQREDDLKEQIRQLQAAKTEAQQSRALNDMKKELDELEDKYEDLIMDGKRDEARTVRKQRQELAERISDYKVATSSIQARTAAVETLKFEAALAKAESEYPEINPDHDGFDEAKTDEVADLTDSLARTKKISRAEAFAKAVKYVLGEPKKADTEKTGTADKAAREEAARRKAFDAANKSPANLAEAGKDSDKAGSASKGLDIMRMNQAQFDKLDDETKALNRGDALA